MILHLTGTATCDIHAVHAHLLMNPQIIATERTNLKKNYLW